MGDYFSFLWYKEALNLIKDKVPEYEFNTLFNHVEFYSYDVENNLLTVNVPSLSVYACIENNPLLLFTLKQVLTKVFGDGIKLSYLVPVVKN